MKRSRSYLESKQDEQFWQKLNEMGLAHDEIQKRTMKILKLQKQLQSVVDDRAWQIYLTIESEINERDAVLLDLLRETLERER